MAGQRCCDWIVLHLAGIIRPLHPKRKRIRPLGYCGGENRDHVRRAEHLALEKTHSRA